VWLWLTLRIYTVLCSFFAAYLAGLSVLVIWQRWDTLYYVAIVSTGYSAHDGTTNFHPLFPWLARLPLPFSGLPIIALLLVSSIATLGSYVVFDHLARLDLAKQQARMATLAFALWPISYVLYLPYTESLWLLCAIAAFLLARKGRWWTASLTAAAATLTRQQGLFLLAPLAWELWISTNHDWRAALKRWRSWVSLFTIPLAYVLWIMYRTFFIFDSKLNFDTVDGFLYSTLLSPATSRVVEGYRFVWPWKASYLAVQRALSLSYLNPWVDLTFGAAFLLLIAFAWRGMRTSYRIYVFLIAVISFSFHTGTTATGGAYLALPRHLLLAFPVFIGLASRARCKLNALVIALAMGLMTVLLFGYFWVLLVP
jgi:hypothetical protein